MRSGSSDDRDIQLEASGDPGDVVNRLRDIVTPKILLDQPEAGSMLIDLDGDPDEVTDRLMADVTPGVLLDTVDMGRLEGLQLFIMIMATRAHLCSLERDEIIGFVERNREMLSRTDILGKLPAMVQQAGQSEKVVLWNKHATYQMQLVLDGRQDEVDWPSDRLLYLCLALGLQVASGRITYEAATARLLRPDTRRRISLKSLRHMLKDYVDTVGGLDDPRVEYLMLLAECALLFDHVMQVKATNAVVATAPPPSDVAAWLDLRRRLASRLRSADQWGAGDEDALRRALDRFATPMSDDDL